MGSILLSPNGKALMLTPRSGSHSIAMAAMQSFWPDITMDDNNHPAASFPLQSDSINDLPPLTEVGMVVRNPIERFRSMAAHMSSFMSLEHLLERPAYGPIPKEMASRYFRFEDQLQECADWLGITTALPKLDEMKEEEKPILSAEQEARVREMYAADIALWESLQ
jgi:hypothetical protein